MIPLAPTPTLLDKRAMDAALLHAVEAGASDIHLQSHCPVIASVHGKLRPLIPRRIQPSELSALCNDMLGDFVSSTIARSAAVNDSYTVRKNRDEAYRFRINAMGCLIDGVDGIQMTLRFIPSEPPNIEALGIEPEIIDCVEYHQGMIAVTGTTGSGKSTLIASLIRHRLEDPQAHEKIMTFESPIEFVYDTIDKHNNIISQCEVPRNLPTFRNGVEESLRCSPTTLLVGEARDTETISECCLFAQTGHLVLTTIHTNSVAETIQRIISIFPENERAFYKANLIDSFRLIVSQRLVPCTDGTRVAVREYLPFNNRIRNVLFKTEPLELSRTVNQLVAQYGRPMVEHAKQRFKDGLINDYTLTLIQRSYGL